MKYIFPPYPALSALSLSLQNDEPVLGAECIESVFPGVVENLKRVLVAEVSE